jgi:D-alanyl-D-alanine carboxypeptidase
VHLRCVRGITVLAVVAATLGLGAPGAGATQSSANAALATALHQLVASPGGPPMVAVVVDRGTGPTLVSAGTTVVGTTTPPALNDQMRLASVAKAFSGAVALALVRSGTVSLGDTVGRWLPSLPTAWSKVTIRQLLNHTSGIPDFSGSEGFASALQAAPFTAPPPAQLLSYVANEPLEFKPGSRYRYSNSDNIVVGLIAQAATGRPYESVLQDRVVGPFGLTGTSLPSDATLASPTIHGYAVAPGQPPEDATVTFAQGWAWASGGVSSTPADANRFIRAYVRGAETNQATRAQQFQFVANASSEPPGPGANQAGLALFRYETKCGTVYGHTGNTPGYTQFFAATKDGSRSVVVTANAQLTPKNAPDLFKRLRAIYTLAVCAAQA